MRTFTYINPEDIAEAVPLTGKDIQETITNLNIEIETLENTINFGYTKLSLRCTDEIAELGALKKKRDKLVDEYTNSKNMERTKKIDALVHRSLMSVDTWHAGKPFRSKHIH